MTLVVAGGGGARFATREVHELASWHGFAYASRSRLVSGIGSTYLTKLGTNKIYKRCTDLSFEKHICDICSSLSDKLGGEEESYKKFVNIRYLEHTTA